MCVSVCECVQVLQFCSKAHQGFFPSEKQSMWGQGSKGEMFLSGLGNAPQSCTMSFWRQNSHLLIP